MQINNFNKSYAKNELKKLSFVLKDLFSPINQYINYPKHIKVEKTFIKIEA